MTNTSEAGAEHLETERVGALGGHADLEPLCGRLGRNAELRHVSEQRHEEPVEQRERAEHRDEVAEALHRRPRALLDLVRERAVSASVEPVDEDADVEPDEEADPCDHGKAQHQVQARHDAKDRDDGSARHAERTVRLGPLVAQHQHGRAHDDEREQRPDARHLAHDLDLGEARHDGDDDARDDRRDVGSAESRVNLADAARQQAVTAHGEEDARLAHEHHEQHAGDPCHGAGRHEIRRPVLSDDAQGVCDRRVEEQRDRRRIGGRKARQGLRVRPVLRRPGRCPARMAATAR